MASLYFDIHSGGEITIDDEGIELADLIAAERMALEALGQAILDDARKHRTGVTKVEVRDATKRTIVTVAAVVTISRSHAATASRSDHLT